MREIKFRGLRLYGKGWVRGYYSYSEVLTEHDIRYFNGEYNVCIPVYPESVGQFTGLKDKNGKEIYEGDILKLLSGHVSEIFFYNGGYKLKNSDGETCAFMDAIAKHSEVIGNIHENKDLK